jgi:predicted transcriptional regulator
MFQSGKAEAEAMAAPADAPRLLSLTARVVSAFVANNPIKSEQLAEIITAVHGALSGNAPVAGLPVPLTFRRAVGLRRSLCSREQIISMIDGKPYSTLKEHLTRHGLSPEEYRRRYRLPKDYPMVAPAHSALRRAIAIRTGLPDIRRSGNAKAAPRR